MSVEVLRFGNILLWIIVVILLSESSIILWTIWQRMWKWTSRLMFGIARN